MLSRIVVPPARRVLALTNWYPPHHTGGYEVHCHDVMTRLAARGHHVDVLCSDDRLPGVADDDDGGVEVHRRLRVFFRDGDVWSPGIADRYRIARHDRRALVEVLD